MIKLLLIGGLGTPEIIIIALIVLLLFGGRKIPELMKGIGKGIRSFKKGLNEEEDPNSGDDSEHPKVTSESTKDGEEVK